MDSPIEPPKREPLLETSNSFDCRTVKLILDLMEHPWKRINMYCLKFSSLCLFVTVELEN